MYAVIQTGGKQYRVKKGDTVQVIGPFGNTFLMPNHSPSHLLMVCT
ncbi:MAG: bL21 family ribosomal protein, partial [Bdellovibrionales bacterium]|nr:bL21 family ribosomal protein [Bdellovibrionales bacterium]